MLKPTWLAPQNIHAFSSTRQDGLSKPPFNSLNLGMGSGDALEVVKKNRTLLKDALALPADPLWLQQTHTNTVINANEHHPDIVADACYSNQPGQVCTVLTADCAPIFLCDQHGQEIAAIHAGWRGLYSGIIAETFKHFKAKSYDIMAWIGPCIHQAAYEVSDALYQQFIDQDHHYQTAFIQIEGRWHASLPQIAAIQLEQLDIEYIFTSGYCTYANPQLFFSYRYQQPTGRMAHLIWITEK